MTERQIKFIEKVAKYAQADAEKKGLKICSVTIAQAILESGWGESELAKKANNLFGMKKVLSGNSWKGSAWDGKSVHKKATLEYDKNNKPYQIVADFRKYPSIKESIADHSAYLLGAMDGKKKRYAGLKDVDTPHEFAAILQKGGYATNQSYADQICFIISSYRLEKYDRKKDRIMKINVHAGHTKQSGKACGAGSKKTGVYESIEDRKIKNEVIKLLKERGAVVHDCTSEGNSASDNLHRIVDKCNAHNVDLDVSIHLNCYDGSAHGTETLIYSSGSKAKSYAKKIDANISKLGFTDRGVKVRSDLYVLHWTNAPALLVETFFCDSQKDCKLYEKVGYKGIAKAIADGILKEEKQTTAKPKTTKKNNTQSKTNVKKKTNTEIAKEVIAGKWGNGETRKKKLRIAGYDYTAIQKIVNQLLK